MLRSLLRAFLVALSCVMGSLSGGATANAADRTPFAKAPPPEGPVEWGSGWYLRGDVGWQNLRVPVVTSDFTKVNNINNVVNLGLGVGYQVNNWLRFDVTADRSVFRMNRALDTVWCPYSPLGLFRYDPVLDKDVPVGMFADPNETCWPFVKGTLNRTSILANGYIDLGHYRGFTPYIGAGVGASYNQASSSLVYYRTSDGGVWAPDLTMPEEQNVPRWITLGGAPWPIQLPFGPTNYNRFSEKKSWAFAWNVMAGVAYDIQDNLKIDVGYRYLNAGNYTSLPGFWTQRAAPSGAITSHEVRVGLRLTAY